MQTFSVMMIVQTQVLLKEEKQEKKEEQKVKRKRPREAWRKAVVSPSFAPEAVGWPPDSCSQASSLPAPHVSCMFPSPFLLSTSYYSKPTLAQRLFIFTFWWVRK